MEERYRDGFIPEYMAYGKKKLDNFIVRLFFGHVDTAEDTEDIRDTCLLLHDFYDHGFSFRVTEFSEEDNPHFRHFYRISERVIGISLERDRR